MKKLLILLGTMLSLSSFGGVITNVVIGDRIVVVTNDTSAIKILKNTYRLDSVRIKNEMHEFYFPKKSETRIVTNLWSVNYKITLEFIKKD